MDETQIRAGLHQAYALLKQGQREPAIAILKQIIQEKPDEANAWWLMANAVDDPKQRKIALQRAIMFDPNHAQARAAYEKLTGEPVPSAATGGNFPTAEPPAPVPPSVSMGRYGVSPTPPPPEPKATAKASDSNATALIGVILILAALGIGVMVVLAVVMGGEDESPSAQAIATPTASITPRVVAVPATTLPDVRNPTLPPAISPSPTVIVTLPTNTPRPTLFRPPTRTPFAGTPLATLNRDAINSASGSGGAGGAGGVPIATEPADVALEIPPSVGEDYWYGFDGTMNEYTQQGGYYRFFEFPVLFYAGPVPDPSFAFYIDDALAQIRQVMPIERTNDYSEARLFLEFMPRNELQAFCNSTSPYIEGCGALGYDIEIYELTGRVEYYGYAAIAADTTIPEVVIVHELLHGVGVMVHSNSPNDIMYYRYTEGFVSTEMTERDLNTLRRLYNARAFGEE